MRLFGSDRIARWMDRAGAEEGEVITHPWVTGAISQAQKRVELQNFQARKKLLEYDDVMNQQREVIYSLRLFALEGGEELKAEALRMIDAAVERLVDELIGVYEDPGEWDREQLATEFLLKFLLSVPDLTDPAKVRTRDDLVHAAQQAGREAFRASCPARRRRRDVRRDLEARLRRETDPVVRAAIDARLAEPAGLAEQALSQIMLTVIDEKWKDHLYDLDQLRAAHSVPRAGARRTRWSSTSRRPIEMFVGLMHDLRTTFAERWLKLQIEIGPPPAARCAPWRPRRPAGRAPAPRRPTPMVATKAEADGLDQRDDGPTPRPTGRRSHRPGARGAESVWRRRAQRPLSRAAAERSSRSVTGRAL